MRKSCLACATKHIAQAIVLTIEARMGYPMHLWFAVGHLAEAEAELLTEHEPTAQHVRAVRLRLMGEGSKEKPFTKTALVELLEEVRSIAENASGKSDGDIVHDIFKEGVQK